MKIVGITIMLLTVSYSYASEPLPTNCETPASLACIYGLTPTVPGCPRIGTTINPSGGWGTIAVVESLDNPNSQNDLDIFSSYFSLPQTTISIYYTPASPQPAPLASGCSNLLPLNLTPPASCTTDSGSPCNEHVADIEWVHAMAPNAKILMFEAPSDNIADKMYAVCYAAAYVAQAGGGLVSMSWTTHEFPEEVGYDKYFQSQTNVVYVGSAGDYSAPANYPGASPYVVSAGGTSIIRNSQGAFTGETAWSTEPGVPSGSKNGASGGPSKYEPRPAYQNSVMKVVGAMRGTPDISFNADPATGVCVYSTTNGGWFRDGGTSIAAPALSGIINVANHRASSSVEELTYIYGNAVKNYHSYWHDVLQGYNGFYALTGYDFTTGLGSPRGYQGK